MCMALPNGSKIAAISSEMPSGILNDVEGRERQIFGEGARAVDADAERVAAQMAPPGAAVAAVAAGDVAFAGDAIADLEAAHLAADLDDLADDIRGRRAIGTGMVFCAHSSQL